MESISTILANTLDLIRQRSRCQLEQMDFIPLTAVSARATDPLLSQIASSQVDKPTYWKDSSKPSSSASVAVKPTLISSKSTVGMSKKKKEQQKKGEEYKDKTFEKHASKDHRKSRLQTMKKLY